MYKEIDSSCQTMYNNDMELISKIYKFKLEPTFEEVKKLNQWIGTCRFLYNLCLEHRILSWQQNRNSVSEFDQSNELKNLKKCEGFEWIKETPSDSLQQTIRDLDRAYKSFWKSSFGYPKFKKRGQSSGLRFPVGKNILITKLNKTKSHIKLPKIGNLKFRSNKLKVDGRIRSATITKVGEDFFVSINCEVENKTNYKTAHMPSVGIDRGIAVSIKTSNDVDFNLPEKDIKKLEKRISKKQFLLRNKKRHSNNYKKAQKQIGKIHKKITNIRHNFLHKTSSTLSKNHGIIVLEKLIVKNMSKSSKGNLEKHGKMVAQKSGLNRSILRQGWSEFARQIVYKTEWNSGKVIFVNPKNTSRECSVCGHTCAENRLTQDKFLCTNEKCKHEENADLNASKVILARGLRDNKNACGVSFVGDHVEAVTSKPNISA